MRESPHAKLAFLDVVQANVGPVDPLTFFETVWEGCSLLQGSDRLADLPNARLLANGGMAAPGVVIKTAQPKGGPGKYQLVTSVSKGALELGPRAIQQDAVHVGAVRGCVPFVVVCDGHGYVNLLNNQPSDTSPDLRNTLHVGGRQVASSPPPRACRCAALARDKRPLRPRALRVAHGSWLLAGGSSFVAAAGGRNHLPDHRAVPRQVRRGIHGADGRPLLPQGLLPRSPGLPPLSVCGHCVQAVGLPACMLFVCLLVWYSVRFLWV